jgi:FkbM family methyltransferase
MIKKISSFFRLVAFLWRYQGVNLVGGPTLVRLISHQYRPALRGYYSQSGQDALLTNDLFQVFNEPGFPKVFVDVGCNHPVIHNNSLFFEQHLGFRVIAIDALPVHQNKWKIIRPQAEFVLSAVGDKEGIVDFEEIAEGNQLGDMFSSVKGASIKEPKLGRSTRSVEIRTLSTILAAKGVASVGILSIDVEGYELPVARGIDFDSVDVRVIVVENNADGVMGSDVIRDYLIGRGYRYHARLWNMDDVFVRAKGHSSGSTQGDFVNGRGAK